MKKLFWRYVLLFVVSLFAEMALGRLELGQWFTPLLYIVPLVVLPTKMLPISTLIIGALLGMVGDIVMGTVALNTIAAMATAMFRPVFMRLTIDSVTLRKRNPLTTHYVGQKEFWQYAIMLTGVHCIIFFAFEALTFDHILYTLGRIGIAWLTLITFTWLVVKIIPRKIR